MSAANRVTVCFSLPLVTCVVLWWAGAVPLRGQGAFPPRLDAYFTKVLKLGAEERKALLGGAPVAKNLDADPAKEVAIFGAIWIAAPVAKYVAALQDIENFEKGEGFRATKKIGEPARVEDFAALTLPDDDVKDLKVVQGRRLRAEAERRGAARVKKEVDWSKPDAKAQLERLIRVMAPTTSTRTGREATPSSPSIATANHPTFVANEFREMVNGMPELVEYLTDMRQYLLEYPKAAARADDLLHLLAGGGVRAQADHSHQPRGHPGRKGRDDRRVEAALFEPLLLDRAGAARAGARSVARHRLLVRQRQPQSLGRPERLRRPNDPRQGARRRAQGPGVRAHRREEEARGALTTFGPVLALS